MVIVQSDIIKEGLDFIICHFVGQGQGIWSPSRGILVGSTSVYHKVHSIREALSIFQQAEFKDCRINAYPRPSKHRVRYPSLLFFDVDDGKDLYIMLERIERILGGHPTVLETSPRRYHILQPIDAKPLADFFLSELDEFLGFANHYISDGVLTCSNHHPSLNSCMLRVPFSINTKTNFQVSIVKKWDGVSASVDKMQLPFAEFLAKKTVRSTVCSIRRSGVGYKWIANLLPVPYGRQIIIWKILAPYLINILKVSEEEAIEKIMDWLDKCSVLRPTHIIKHVVKSHVRNAQTFRDANDKRLVPISLPRLKKEYEGIYNLIR